MLVCMGVGALFSSGALGPLAALLTLLLPPEIKSFALSVHEFVAFLLAPIYSVIMGVGLQVRPRNCLLISMYSLQQNRQSLCITSISTKDLNQHAMSRRYVEQHASASVYWALAQGVRQASQIPEYLKEEWVECYGGIVPRTNHRGEQRLIRAGACRP